MNLLRLLLLGAAIYIVIKLIQTSRRAVTRQQNAAQPPRHEPTYEPMARCAKCGAHLPQSALSRAQLCGHCSD